MVGDSPVSQDVVVVSKLLRSVHQKPNKFREGKFEHFVRILICLRMVFVPDPADVSVLTVHELIEHGREDGGEGVAREVLQPAVPWLLGRQTSLGADGGPALSYELVFITPVLQHTDIIELRCLF